MPRLPGPPELFARRPDAVVDLRSSEGAAIVGARWRYAPATVREVEFVEAGVDLGPSGPPNRTLTIDPPADADDSGWPELAPEDLARRVGSGRVSFAWYRTTVTVPDRVGDLDPTGATIVLEIVVDDYAEVWVDGRLPRTLGDVGGHVAAGFNAPNRVALTRDARPGQTFAVAVFGINGPISADPRNYLWIRAASLDVYRRERAAVGEPADLRIEPRHAGLDAVVPPGTVLERIATGFDFTEGPVWVDGALLFSSPDANTIYRWAPNGAVTVFRTKSGYAGLDIGRYRQPGANGVTLDPDGNVVLCEHGNRRVLRINPHGDTSVLADQYDGKRLNSPNDLVFRADGTLYFTDPPFGLPETYDDPKKELAFSGVFRVSGATVHLVTDELGGPNGIALSPDERRLYVGNWEADRKVVVRFDVADDGSTSNPVELCNLTAADGDDGIDGIKVDRAGNLFVCGPGGVWVVAPDGDVLGRLVLPEAPHNVAWGDPDGDGLYVCATTSVYHLRLPAGGTPPGPKEI